MQPAPASGILTILPWNLFGAETPKLLCASAARQSGAPGGLIHPTSSLTACTLCASKQHKLTKALGPAGSTRLEPHLLEN